MTTIARTMGRGIARGALPRVGLGVQVLVLLSAAACVLGGAVGTLVQRTRTDAQVARARQDAVAAARADAEKILSYDYRTLEQGFAQAKAVTTGKFRGQYEETTRKLVSGRAKQHKAVVRARVVAASVVRATPDEAVTLLFVDQTTTSDLVEGTKVDQDRVRMTLRNVDGRWLVSKIDAL